MILEINITWPMAIGKIAVCPVSQSKMILQWTTIAVFLLSTTPVHSEGHSGPGTLIRAAGYNVNCL